MLMSIRPGSIVSVSCTSTRGETTQTLLTLLRRLQSAPPAGDAPATPRVRCRTLNAPRCRASSRRGTCGARGGDSHRRRVDGDDQLQIEVDGRLQRELPPEAAVDVGLVAQHDQREGARYRRRCDRAVDQVDGQLVRRSFRRRGQETAVEGVLRLCGLGRGFCVFLPRFLLVCVVDGLHEPWTTPPSCSWLRCRRCVRRDKALGFGPITDLPSVSITRPCCVMYRIAPLSRLTTTKRSSTPDCWTEGRSSRCEIFAAGRRLA